MPAVKTSKKRKISTEDLRNFVGVGDPQISPDGNYILFSRSHTNDKTRFAAVCGLPTAKPA